MSESIAVIAQKPVSSRYTAMWHEHLRDDPRFDVLATDVITHDRTRPYNYFTNLEAEVEYEFAQLYRILIMREPSLKHLLVCDLDFPGCTAAMLPALKLKFPEVKLYGILHGGTWNNGDIFEGSTDKSALEYAAIKACSEVFVATRYHAERIRERLNQSCHNLHVLNGLPFDYEHVSSFRSTPTKFGAVIGRHEQVNGDIAQAVSHLDTIQDALPRDAFLQQLAEYQVAVIPKVEETFGYQAVECVALNVVPLVPDDFSFQEMYPRELRYGSVSELLFRLAHIEGNPETTAELLRGIDVRRYATIWDRIYERITQEYDRTILRWD